MTCSGAYGFLINEREKVSYNHSNSEPSKLGINILKFIQNNSLLQLTKVACRIKLVSNAKKTYKNSNSTLQKFEYC